MADLEVRLGAGIPAYQQIIEQIKNQIAGGKLVAGSQLPTVRDLAQRLELNPSTVAKAYVELEREGIIMTRRGGGSFVAGLTDDPFMSSIRDERLFKLLGRAIVEALSLGFEPEEVEANVAVQLALWRENRAKRIPTGAPLAAPESKFIFVGSNDLAVEALLGQLRRTRPDLPVSTVHSGSMGGLIALEQGGAHIAGCHLLDEETGEYNWPYVRRILPAQDVVLVTVVERTQGLMVPKGNPLGIQGFPDLARPGIRFINRQRGSGTRVLLDFNLRRLEIAPCRLIGYEREEETHVGVASAIAEGTADVGLGIWTSARSLGLDFIPVQKERYDLAMLRSVFESSPVQSLLTILRGEEFRRVVSAMGGYDVTMTGQLAEPRQH